MEDILASIRRIIADDQSQVGRGLGNARRPAAPSIAAPVVNEPVSVEPHRYEEVLDLAQMPEAAVSDPRQPAPAPQIDHLAASHELYAEETETSSVAPAPHTNGYGVAMTDPASPVDLQQKPSSTAAGTPGAPQARFTPETTEGLISPRLGASVMSSFETLAATVVLQNQDMLDRVMHDALRPLLKSWLDENLPTLVERLVRAEIERMARGSRG